MKFGLFAAAASAALLASAAPASAAIIFGFTPGGSSPHPGLIVIEDFEALAPATIDPASFGYQLKVPPSDGGGAVIPTSTYPGTRYLSVLAGGSATINLGAGVTRFSFDWGSLDDYNTLKINLGGGGFINVIPGTTIVNTPANGNQFLPGTNGSFSALATAGETFTSINLTSTTNSFEIDNVAVGVPEPATWGLMILGFGAAGAMIRRRRMAIA